MKVFRVVQIGRVFGIGDDIKIAIRFHFYLCGHGFADIACPVVFAHQQEQRFVNGMAGLKVQAVRCFHHDVYEFILTLALLGCAQQILKALETAVTARG